MLFVMSPTLNRGNRYLFAHISSNKLIAIQCITLLDRRKENKMEIEKEKHRAGDNSGAIFRDDVEATLTFKDLDNHAG